MASEHEIQTKLTPGYCCTHCVFIGEAKTVEDHVLRMHHTGTAPFVCRKCDERFARKERARNHVRKNRDVPRRTRRSGRWPLLGPSRKGPSRTLHLPSHGGNPARARTARSCPSTHLEKIPSWPLCRVSPSPLWVQREALLLTTLLPLGQRSWRCIGSSCSSSRSRRLCCPP